MRSVSPVVSQIILFLFGWISWTFLEYIAHRFWMPFRATVGRSLDQSNHQYHYTHPTEIKITDTHRLFLLLPGIMIMIISIRLQNYFIIFGGLYAGFLTYLFMHGVLHRKWSAMLFPRLLQNHILHHCRFPNKCFGITVTWWDTLFGTAAPNKFKISEKVMSYYFGGLQEKKENEIHEKLKISQNFYNN
jgi:sterol desaturase/sphingolipid hydroxylase (fatty acid hydroxylase superfamily)